MKTFDELYKESDFSFLEPKEEEDNSDELFKVEEEDVNIPKVEPKQEEKPAEQPQARLSDDDIQRIAAAIFAMQKPAEQKGETE